MDKQRLRFSLSDDITLLQEILCENPFHDLGKWSCIQTKVNEATSKCFSIRSLKDHLQHLMTCFVKEDGINSKKSRTEEECNELKVLLQDVFNLYNEFSHSNKKRKYIKKPENTNISLGEDTAPIFEYSLPAFIKDRQPQDEVIKRAEFELQTKRIRLEEAALEVEKEKLRLEEDKLKFERYKFETESKEREVRLKLEVEEREERLRGDREQRKMLVSLIQTVIGIKEEENK